MLSEKKSTRIFFLKFQRCMLAALLVFSSSGQADDTDLYMGTGTTDAAATHPNVLFILDTSGSMNVRDAGSNRRTARMTVLKDAMSDLLTTLNNVNVGISRFSNTGGSVIFPISPISGNSNIIVGESTKVQALEFKAALVNKEDDGEERVGGANAGMVSLNDKELDAFDFGSTVGQTGTTTVAVAVASDDISEFNNNGRMLNTSFAYIHQAVSLGLRFQSVSIPQGQTIQSAFLEFTNAFRQTSRTNAVVSGLDIADTPTFTTQSRDLSSRQTTSATVAWDGIPGGNRNTKFESPDIKEVVQEIVNRSDWQSGNSMGFKIFTSRGARFPHSRNRSSTLQPKLRINIAATAGSAGEDQLIALRFEDIRIPKGATLTSAKLLLTNSKGKENDGVGEAAADWRIQLEQVDDSLPLNTTANNLSSRQGGGTVIDWTVKSDVLNENITSSQCSVQTSTGGAVTCKEQFTSPTNELKSIVEQVTSRSGWCGGNSITFLLDANSPTANEARKLHSRDSDDAQLAPKFVYSYMPQKGCMTSVGHSQVASSGDDAEQFSDSYYGSRVNTVRDELVLGEDPQQGSQTVGLRFTSVDVPKGVTIKEAHIEFKAKGTSTGAADYTIKAVNEGNVGPITNRANAISQPPTTTASASWTLSGTNAEDDWDTPGAEHVSPDLTAVVQEVINRNDWSSKNNMAFVITGTGTRRAESFDSDPSKAPRLVIKYDDTLNVPFKSVREVLKEKVKALPARGGTPIAGAMLETAKYFRGEGMVHGKHRGSYGQISHPATYCVGPNNCPGAKHTQSGGGYYGGGGGKTDEFFVLNPNQCNKNNLGSFRCRNRKINGSPKYLSPIKTDLECAANHQVLLTDGQAGGSDAGRIMNLMGKKSCYADNKKFKLKEHALHKYSRKSYYGNNRTSESCVPDLVEFMASKDQNKSIPGEQNVKTHTVAFALKSAGPVQFLKDVANLGGGGFYSADTAGDLQEVFKVILSEVRSAPTSFAAPSLAVDAFNKIKSRDDVYFGMFTPQLTQRWNGNVKKYKICLNASCGTLGTIIDAKQQPVVDSTTDPKKPVFRKDVQSFWSAGVDGKKTTLGGAGGMITDHEQVTLFTDRKDSNPVENTNNTTLDQSGFKFEAGDVNSSELSTMRSAICKNPSATQGSECEKRMLWLLGKKHVTEPDTDVNSTTRWAVGDVMHSAPTVITYGGTPGKEFFDKIVYGSNSGMLHMINGDSGHEEWRYLPSDFWPAQRQLFDNRQDKHMYGMDMPPTVWQCDQNNNGKIEFNNRDTVNNGNGTCFDVNDDFVRVFVSTRRGGGDSGFIYALDLTGTVQKQIDEVTPKFMWRIRGGNTTGDFRRLGQTWSQPRITTIMVISKATSLPTPKDVLIFGGGYDTKLDDKTKHTVADNDGNDYLGNAIYIVDPMTGKRILSISGKGSGADITVDKMHFSIPSDIEFLDSNNDGLTDRLYVGDTGGQVWRVDLADAVPQTGNRAAGFESGSKGTVVGLLASIGGNSPENQRRFFEPPSVVQVTDKSFSTSEEYDLVMLGTGTRPDPLGETVRDKFYAFRDRHISNNALNDSDGNHVSGQNDEYPKQGSQPYSHTDAGSLLDITVQGVAAQARTDENLVKASDGFFFDMFKANGRAGEKVLSSPITAGGAVSFTTFDPASDATNASSTTAAAANKKDPCSATPNIGTARAYHLNILTAEPPEVSEVSGGTGANRFRKVIGSGIPSDVIPVFTDSGVVGIAQTDGRGVGLGQLSRSTPERAYWNESVDF